jgi:hypothetical protein
VDFAGADFTGAAGRAAGRFGAGFATRLPRGAAAFTFAVALAFAFAFAVAFAFTFGFGASFAFALSFAFGLAAGLAFALAFFVFAGLRLLGSFPRFVVPDRRLAFMPAA